MYANKYVCTMHTSFKYIHRNNSECNMLVCNTLWLNINCAKKKRKWKTALGWVWSNSSKVVNAVKLKNVVKWKMTLNGKWRKWTLSADQTIPNKFDNSEIDDYIVCEIKDNFYDVQSCKEMSLEKFV